MSRALLVALALAVACAPGGDERPEANPAGRVVRAVRIASARFARSSQLRRAIKVDLPARANGALRIAVDAGEWIEIVARDLEDTPSTFVDAAVVFEDPKRALTIVHTVEDARAEEFRVLHAPALVHARYEVRFGPGIARLREHGDRIEAVDASGSARFATETMWAADARGERRAIAAHLLDDHTIGVDVDAREWPAPVVVDPSWIAVGSMSMPRRDSSLVKLADGRVLSLGGDSATRSTDIFDPSTGAWVAGPSLQIGRKQAAGVLLDGGKLLVVGGQGGAALASCEVLDPATGTFALVAPMSTPRRALANTIANLSGGRVLITGGWSDTVDAYSTAEIYDPATNAWSVAPAMRVRRMHHRATALADGRVLVSGGCASATPSGCTSNVDIYDPVAGTWAVAASMSIARAWHVAQRLSDGKVLVAGGTPGAPTTSTTGFLSSAELYDPATNAWRPLPSMPTRRNLAAWGPSRAGGVIVAGGEIAGSTALASAAIFDPVTETWSAASDLSTPRFFHLFASLAPGTLLVAGGTDGATSLSSAELFREINPDPLGVPCKGALDCMSGHCVDGVCCDTACTGQCEACDIGDTKGQCLPARGAPHGARKACGASPATNICLAQSCDGVDRMSCRGLPAAETDCAPARCSDGAETNSGKCDGVGACRVDAPRDCAPFQCDATACRKSCAADEHCVAGFVCRAGACIAPASPPREAPANASLYGCTGGSRDGDGQGLWLAIAAIAAANLRRRLS